MRSELDRRGGFTLIELIVVIGLMALLSTISVGGYFAASRGMAARGTIQDVSSIIRQAWQTCVIDQVPTAVLFCNRRQNTVAEGGEAYGTVVAIKMAGRISYIAKSGCKAADGGGFPNGVQQQMLVDEFADWNQSYPLGSSKAKGKERSIRFYQMSSPNGHRLSQGVESCSSLMCAWVGYVELDTEYLPAYGGTIDDWCNINRRTANDNRSFSHIGYNNANSCRWGLPFHPDNAGLNVGAWHVGDAYGVEIATLDLPKSYIFGNTPPSGTKLEKASSPAALVFTPSMLKSGGQETVPLSSAGGNVTITMLNDLAGGDKETVGVITADILKD